MLHLYCNVEVPEFIETLRYDIDSGDIPATTAELIRAQLLDAIKGNWMTPDDYKLITGDNEYTTNELLKRRLIEIWNEVFPEEPISPSQIAGHSKSQ